MLERRLAALALAGLLAACNGENTLAPGTGGAGPTQFARAITVGEFDSLLANGPTRVEIELYPGSLVAREVEAEETEDLTDEEKIESRITAIDPAGNITLALGGLVVTFDGATDFESDDGHLTMQQFIDRVEAALATGVQPAVEAKRPPPDQPQDPNDATFHAGELDLDHDADEDEIEMNVDADNISGVSATSPDAILTVLGLAIEIDVSGGRTELESEIEDDRLESEFEGDVASVSGSLVTLTDGTVIEIVVGTEIEQADDEGELGSLAAVEAALAAGLVVEADGEGVVTATSPRTITASEIEFEIDD